MIFEKGKLSISINKKGWINITYRRLVIELGFFNNEEGISLFTFTFLNKIASIQMFEIIGIKIFGFQFNMLFY